MRCEVTVILKSEDVTFRKKFNCYDPIRISEDCLELKNMIDQTKYEFKGIPDEIQIKTHTEWMEG